MASPTAGPSRHPSPQHAIPLTPPPLYSLVMPGLHRCSAIGLEEALNEAWAEEEAATRRRQHVAPASTSGSNGSSNARMPSLDARRASEVDDRYSDHVGARHPSRSQTSFYPPSSPTSHLSPSIPNPSPSPLVAFLHSISLRTLVYLSPSLLPCALLKLAHQLDLNLIQWDLTGPKVWRARSIAEEGEVKALRRFASRHAARSKRRDKGREASPDEKSEEAAEQQESADALMTLSLITLLLTSATSPTLICDPSGLAQTSLVVGCLRRMQRRSFASICVEYRAFASSSSPGATVNAARAQPGQLPSTASALRFIEMFPLEKVELPDNWDEMVGWGREGLRAMEGVVKARETEGEGQSDQVAVAVKV
ncbi:hypothetical protein BDZ90DRAFT_230225 [Jaminaea rosea]|uniref:Uncharacterized protein n=1 Tax=Jaminaea rosea TaxID=1569628 RepID=A0A316UVT0_9BASI|nr:hypothetical protein BDZ90DRAFT_230225 [Jaminaea rosea]PWN29342.1 hypothetical protein BDZ90DRAFT_230225 [Jaminaea rosea]